MQKLKRKTKRQKLGLSVQMKALQNCNTIYSEKQSRSNNDRPELAKAIRLAKKLTSQGKQVTLYIYKLKRLTRRMSKLGLLINKFNHYSIKR